ncbi:hypothetical protein M4D54_08260 [Brachybacterium sp. p3-SID1565]|uniref:hypothetical protein n=1 Tax=Brachybacterium sp. p3-SID1565 TaxID=2916046 RepID=UPI0021A4AFA7|nr:hypothetical protein [Brachybacterium sp. p3-SID1565]MCT1385621.1 hypothetical protein [Brachybacterium sp. p3-SID1565]
MAENSKSESGQGGGGDRRAQGRSAARSVDRSRSQQGGQQRGDRKRYGERTSSADRAQGERRQYGERKQYGERRQGGGPGDWTPRSAREDRPRSVGEHPGAARHRDYQPTERSRPRRDGGQQRSDRRYEGRPPRREGGGGPHPERRDDRARGWGRDDRRRDDRRREDRGRDDRRREDRGRDDRRREDRGRDDRRREDRGRDDRRREDRGRDDRRREDHRSERDPRSYRPGEEERSNRPFEPWIPEGITGKELDVDALDELRGLSRETAERVAKHLVAAFALEEEDPETSQAHAKFAARIGGRIGVVRETYGILAYRAGDYRTAVRELRTALRITGRCDVLPLIADSERGLGRPERALDIAASEDASGMGADAAIELMIVVAGAYADTGDIQTALRTLEIPALRHKVDGRWQVRLWVAYADLLERADRADEARRWLTLAADTDTDGLTDAAERLGRPAPEPAAEPSWEDDEEILVVDAFEEEQEPETPEVGEPSDGVETPEVGEPSDGAGETAQSEERVLAPTPDSLGEELR